MRISLSVVEGLLWLGLAARLGLAAPLTLTQRSLEIQEYIETRCGTYISPDHRLETEHALHQHRLARRALAVSGLEEREEPEEGRGGAPAPTEAELLKPVSFDVYWHVVYANETKEGGYVSDEQIAEQMDVMNEAFKSTNISWTFVNTTRIENPDWFVNVWPGSPQEQEMKKKYHKGDSTKLNVFTAQFNQTTKSLGFASLPSTYLRSPLSDGLLIKHTTLPHGSHANYSLGKTTVHELGHWLGLYHTFEGGCEGVGDNISDTPPEEVPSVGCPVGRKTCKGSWEEDPIHNYMDYSFDSCMTHFTPGQATRMHEVIWAFRTARPPSSVEGVKENHPHVAVSASLAAEAEASATGTASSDLGASSPGPSTESDSGRGEEEEGSEEGSTQPTPTPTPAPGPTQDEDDANTTVDGEPETPVPTTTDV